ncbi:hypothetical protein B0H13DRAFT_1851358 [Mycena leptocephala]|nr:hypothetical protein B0H13DRAFT_1851358 [Mycena leptocephala]
MRILRTAASRVLRVDVLCRIVVDTAELKCLTANANEPHRKELKREKNDQSPRPLLRGAEEEPWCVGRPPRSGRHRSEGGARWAVSAEGGVEGGAPCPRLESSARSRLSSTSWAARSARIGSASHRKWQAERRTKRRPFGVMPLDRVPQLDIFEVTHEGGRQHAEQVKNHGTEEERLTSSQPPPPRAMDRDDTAAFAAAWPRPSAFRRSRSARKKPITFPAGRLLNPGFGTHAVRPAVYFAGQATVERREMEGIVDGRNQIQALTSMDRILTLPNQLHVLVDENAS